MFSHILRPLVLSVVAGISLTGIVSAAEPHLDLELVTEAGFKPEDARRWFALFEELKISGVRIRGGQRGDRVGIEPIGKPPTSYRITGILTPRNQLDLPGGRFTLFDKAAIATWAAKVRAGGEDALFDKPGAFGLTEKELKQAQSELSAAITFSTKGKPVSELVEQVLREVEPIISLDAAAQIKLENLDPCLDELTGLSAGTVLAALLRPAGLALVPASQNRTVTYKVVDSQSVAEVWPVGWKPTRQPREYVPDLLKFLTVEIEETPLPEVLSAVVDRLQVPLVIDQNSLVRERIDLAVTKVSLPKTNTFYQKILERALFQAKLKMELRVDEKERPLLWITTIKQ